MRRTTRQTLAPLLLLLLLAATTGVGCAPEEPEGPDPAESSSPVAMDGEGMQPRIVTEHPIDAPGRPGSGGDPSIMIEPAAAARWIPHLEVSDLTASTAFYREHGFILLTDPDTTERVELDRDGVRLVLVAAPARSGGEPPNGGEETPAPPAAASVVLHLADEGTEEGPQSLRDPDGHRLALPGGG